MRVILPGILLLLMLTPACAHDSYYGLMCCYGHRHCAQNTCVFGIIVGQSPTDFTLLVTKTLRGRNVAGRRIRLRNRGWEEVNRNSRVPLAVGDAIVVSYHSRSPKPHQPHYLVRSATTDWRTMTVLNGTPAARKDIDPFVRSGGAYPPLSPQSRWLLFLDVWGSLMVGCLLLVGSVMVLTRMWMRQHYPPTASPASR